jgi:hypothetical protein
MWFSLPFALLGLAFLFLLEPAARTISSATRILAAVALLAVVVPLQVAWIRWVPLIKR